MKASIADIVTACAVAGLGALGGALAVFSEYDDAPGGVLIGLLLIAGGAALGVWQASRRGADQGVAARDRGR